MIKKELTHRMTLLAFLVVGGCKGTGTAPSGAGTPEWVPSRATSFSGSSATPPHRLPATEYPFDASGRYLPDLARMGERRFSNTSTSKPPSRASSTSSSRTSRKPATSSRSHRVASGDTLWSLSRKYGVSVAAIKRANGMSSDKLVNGRTLRIP